MPWSEGRVDERKRLIRLWEHGATPTELARRFGVSRPTVYETIRRWQSEGVSGLDDRSRAPHSSPNQTTHEVMAALLSLKDQYVHFGPDKLVRLLRDKGMMLSASTARDILRRNGRVRARRARPAKWSPAETPRVVIPGEGHTMTADHKGGFQLQNGRYCHPLTIADPASRYVFAVDALSSTSVQAAVPVFDRVFREWGLPEQIVTDNGPPFCTARSIGGLTDLSKMWIKLGIRHVRTEPGRPQQNGRHERMHRTLKEAATKPAERSLAAQQKRFDCFVHEFNHVRPHQALRQETPATRVKRYRRDYPTELRTIEYPSSFEVRTVRSNGEIKWKGDLLFVGTVLRDERVALLQTADARWSLFFAEVELAVWDERTRKFAPPSTPRSEDLSASPPGQPAAGTSEDDV